MSEETPDYFGWLEEIKGCTCLLKFLCMIDDQSDLLETLEALELCVEHHRDLTLKGLAHPLTTPN